VSHKQIKPSSPSTVTRSQTRLTVDAADARAVVREARARVVADERGNYTQIRGSPKTPFSNTSQRVPNPPNITPYCFIPLILYQNSYCTYDYSYDTPKYLWHIGTSGAILIWGALRAPQIPAATASFAR
jgi:hypothetical protein